MYRDYTPNETAAIAAAFRTFLARTGHRKPTTKAANEYVSAVLGEGLPAETLFIPDYVPGEPLTGAPDGETLAALARMTAAGPRHVTDVRGWNEGTLSDALAEALHDFYQTLTGTGGKWNTPSARENITRAINEDGLETLMSETLIELIRDKYGDSDGEETRLSFFAFVAGAIKELWKLRVPAQDQSQSPAPAPAGQAGEEEREEEEDDERDPDPPYMEKEREEEEEPREQEEPEDETDDEHDREAFEDADLVPAPEMAEDSFFQTEVLLENTPKECKRVAVETILKQFTPGELACLATMADTDEPDKLSFLNIVERFTDGDFDPGAAKAEARRLHMLVNTELIDAFVDCVRLNGMAMDAETASGYDILHIDWDLRAPEVRKYYKLQGLILKYGEGDKDLEDAIGDLERLYLEGD